MLSMLSLIPSFQKVLIMFNKLLAVFLVLFALVGCGTTKQVEQVIKVETVYVTVPKHLTKPCLPERPETEQSYMQMKPHERENFLTQYITSLLGTIKDCNSKLSKIDKLQATPAP